MNPINLVDSYILKGHQFIVDSLDKPGRWCAEQTLYAYSTLFIVATAIEPTDPIIIAITVAMVAWMYSWVKRYSDARLASYGELRLMMLGFFCVSFIFVKLNYASMSLAILGLGRDVCLLMFYYFLACQPPKPRVRKKKLVLNNSMT